LARNGRLLVFASRLQPLDAGGEAFELASDIEKLLTHCRVSYVMYVIGFFPDLRCLPAIPRRGSPGGGRSKISELVGRVIKDGRLMLSFVGNRAVNRLNLLLYDLEFRRGDVIGCGRGVRLKRSTYDLAALFNQHLAKGFQVIERGRRAAADICHFLNPIPVSCRR
jgi:hypothetical protein